MKGVNIAHMSPASDYDFEFNYLKTAGITDVRLRTWDFIETGDYNELLLAINSAFKHDVNIVLCLPNKSLWPDYVNYTKEDNLYQWVTIIETIGNHPAVVALEIMNEPHYQYTQQDGFIEHINLVIYYLRKASRKPIIVSLGNSWIWDRPPLNYNDIWYSFHNYDPLCYSLNGIGRPTRDLTYPSFECDGIIWDKEALLEDIQPVIDFKNQYDAQVFVGEFGVENRTGMSKNPEELIQDKIDIYKQNGFHWFYWAYATTEDKYNRFKISDSILHLVASN